MDSSDKLAAVQRQRTFLFYNSLSQHSVKVQLYNGTVVIADELVTVDSSESKFIFKGLETDWGKHSNSVCIRGGDIVSIEFFIGSGGLGE